MPLLDDFFCHVRVVYARDITFLNPFSHEFNCLLILIFRHLKPLTRISVLACLLIKSGTYIIFGAFAVFCLDHFPIDDPIGAIAGIISASIFNLMSLHFVTQSIGILSSIPVFVILYAVLVNDLGVNLEAL